MASALGDHESAPTTLAESHKFSLLQVTVLLGSAAFFAGRIMNIDRESNYGYELKSRELDGGLLPRVCKAD